MKTISIRIFVLVPLLAGGSITETTLSAYVGEGFEGLVCPNDVLIETVQLDYDSGSVSSCANETSRMLNVVLGGRGSKEVLAIARERTGAPSS